MSFFDKRIFEALKDGRPRDFSQILRMRARVDFSHNTLRLHLGARSICVHLIGEYSRQKGKLSVFVHDFLIFVG